MLTGVNQRSTNAIAAQAGVGRVLAEGLPNQKASEIRLWQGIGKVVAMVGMVSTMLQR